MYISRKRKNAYTALAPNRSADDTANTALSPVNSDENNTPAPLTPNNSETEEFPDTYTHVPPVNSDENNTSTPLTPNKSEAEERVFPEANVELINGDNSDLGRAAPTAELMYEEFLAANPQTGSLRVQAYIGAQGLPVSGALVTVSAPFLDGEKVFYAVKTNPDGIADNLILPAPDRSNSQIPGSQNPFAEYNVSVSHPNYRTAVFAGVPVFSGVKSIQPVIFLPRGAEE